MTEWGVRLTVRGKVLDEFKVPKGESAAETYAAGYNANFVLKMKGEAATVITRTSAGDPWEVPGDR